jgi:hypothetical protein
VKRRAGQLLDLALRLCRATTLWQLWRRLYLPRKDD